MDIKFEKLPQNDLEDALALAQKVFTHEQNIPLSLLPINEELNPIWWCARMHTEIVGIAASWVENNEWHWGRFAINTRLRGLGVGKKLAVYSLGETYNKGAENIYVEARDVTIGILKKLGGKVTGEPENFYSGSVTPMKLCKYDFMSAQPLLD